MSIRWLIVAVILLWLMYEYISPLWYTLWEKYSTHIKFICCALIVMCVISLPSVESLAIQYPSVYTLVRQFAIDDGIHTEYYKKQTQSEELEGVHTRVNSGMTLAGADSDGSNASVITKSHTQRISSSSIDSWLREHAPTLRTSIASSQHWTCKNCAGKLYSNFCVISSGAICGQCLMQN